MKNQNSTRAKCLTRYFTVPLLVAGMFFSSEFAMAQDPIPFHAMMQSASTPPAVPPKQDANNTASQPANSGKITAAGKAGIAGGYVLLGAGALTVAFTAVITGDKFAGSKAPTLYATGAGAAAVGVTMIVIGFHRRFKQ
jgi:hypothetical protein